jgi:hypothetical protein
MSCQCRLDPANWPNHGIAALVCSLWFCYFEFSRFNKLHRDSAHYILRKCTLYYLIGLMPILAWPAKKSNEWECSKQTDKEMNVCMRWLCSSGRQIFESSLSQYDNMTHKFSHKAKINAELMPNKTVCVYTQIFYYTSGCFTNLTWSCPNGHFDQSLRGSQKKNL